MGRAGSAQAQPAACHGDAICREDGASIVGTTSATRDYSNAPCNVLGTDVLSGERYPRLGRGGPASPSFAASAMDQQYGQRAKHDCDIAHSARASSDNEARQAIWRGTRGMAQTPSNSSVDSIFAPLRRSLREIRTNTAQHTNRKSSTPCEVCSQSSTACEVCSKGSTACELCGRTQGSTGCEVCAISGRDRRQVAHGR